MLSIGRNATRPAPQKGPPNRSKVIGGSLDVLVNPDDAVTAKSFNTWLDKRQAGVPSDPGLTAAETLAEARAAGEA